MNSRKFIQKLSIITCTLLFLCASSFSQATDNGSIEGTVYDTTNAVIPGVTVTVKNLTSGFEQKKVTNEQGYYKIPVLPIGNYQITAQKDTFQEYKQQITVEASVVLPINIYMSPEGQVNTVTVTTGGESEIITDGTSPSTVITGQKLETAPLAVRSSFSRTAINTETSGDVANANTNGTGNPETSVVGTRTTSSSVVLNGVDATPVVGTGSLSENIAPRPRSRSRGKATHQRI